MRDFGQASQVGAEARDRSPVPVQLPIGQISDVQVRDPAESRPLELGPDIAFPAVRRHQKETGGRVEFTRERQIQHAHHAGIDGGGVLDFEGRRYAIRRGIEPEDVDQTDRLGASAVRQRRRKLIETALAETRAVMEPAPVVGGDPDPIAERASQITKPGLDFRVRAIRLALLRRRLLELQGFRAGLGEPFFPPLARERVTGGGRRRIPP